MSTCSSMIPAAAVDLCVTLPFDAARATVPPINGHDSVPPAIGTIASSRRAVMLAVTCGLGDLSR